MSRQSSVIKAPTHPVDSLDGMCQSESKGHMLGMDRWHWTTCIYNSLTFFVEARGSVGWGAVEQLLKAAFAASLEAKRARCSASMSLLMGSMTLGRLSRAGRPLKLISSPPRSNYLTLHTD
jgi:hypothetical protein